MTVLRRFLGRGIPYLVFSFMVNAGVVRVMHVPTTDLEKEVVV